MGIILPIIYIVIGLLVLYGLYELFYKFLGLGVLIQTVIYLLISFGIYRLIKYNFNVGEFGKIVISILWVIGYGLFGKLCDRIEQKFKDKKELI